MAKERQMTQAEALDSLAKSGKEIVEQLKLVVEQLKEIVEQLKLVVEQLKDLDKDFVDWMNRPE